MRLKCFNARRFLLFVVYSVSFLAIVGLASAQQDEAATDLIRQFYAKQFSWQQFEVAEKLVKLHDKAVLRQLAPFLNDENRHVRGNAAFVFAALGDDRGFEIIHAILDDRSSDRSEGDGVNGNWSVRAQIISDRYYAAHLFGDLKDPRAIPILVPLLKDHDVNRIVPWSLGEIGDKSAIPPLIQTLSDSTPDMRVLAIDALEQLRAKEALPELHLLLQDNEKIHFGGLGTVADAAKSAIAKLEATP